ncbi:unnamed protein product [Urochloa humidicola]
MADSCKNLVTCKGKKFIASFYLQPETAAIESTQKIITVHVEFSLVLCRASSAREQQQVGSQSRNIFASL